MHRGLFIGMLALTGCAQLFGIDETTGPGAGSGVTLSIQRVSIGATVDKAPQDLTNETAQFLVGDASSLVPNSAVITAPGTWSSDIPDGTPAAQFTLPDLPMGATHLWELPSRAMKGNLVAFEHPGAMPPAMTSQIALSVTIPPYNNEQLTVYSVGTWLQHTLTAAEVPALMATTVSTTIPYTSFAPLLASVTPSRITASDVVLVLEYTGADLTGVLQATAFDQTDATDTISGTLTTVTHDKMLAVPLPTDLATRYSAVRPAVGAPATSWSLAAAPGASAGNAFGPQLLAGTPAATDTMITAMYGDPFESLGWPAVLVLSTSATRTYMLGGVAVPLSATLTAFADASTNTAPLSAGLPTVILVGTTQLASDGQTLTLDPLSPVTVSFLPDKTTNTLYTATVYELALTGSTYARTPVTDAVTVAGADPNPTFVFPAGTFKSGHTYVITAGCLQGGYPNAAMGDLQTAMLPVARGTLDSGVFTVQ
jgi:hypothetical protein